MSDLAVTRLPPWRWIVTGWLVVALSWSPAAMLVNSPKPSLAALADSLGYNFLNFGVWALATPALLRLCAALPLDAGRSSRNAVLLMLVGIIVVPIITAALPSLQLGWAWLRGSNVPVQAYQPLNQAQRILITSLFAVPTYIAVVAIGQTLVWAARARARAATAADAELRALRAELNPHFLFNTLGGIARLAHSAPDSAERAVARLSDVLRNSLAEIGPQQTLAEAVGEAEEHLALYRILHGDVRFGRTVSEGLWQAVLPARLLVPLIENAMTHGALDGEGQRWVELDVRSEADRALVLTLRNPAPDSAGPSSGLGMGLETARRLLAIHCGKAATLVHDQSAGLFTVRITLLR